MIVLNDSLAVVKQIWRNFQIHLPDVFRGFPKGSPDANSTGGLFSEGRILDKPLGNCLS